jgi:hypothetical protein
MIGRSAMVSGTVHMPVLAASFTNRRKFYQTQFPGNLKLFAVCAYKHFCSLGKDPNHRTKEV